MAEATPYPEYIYSFYPNATITSNRCFNIKGNIVNKNGLIADNKVGDIVNNNSAGIKSNIFPSTTSFFTLNIGSIRSNKLEGVILNNTIGRAGIERNTSLDIINNTTYGIYDNRTRAIVGNNISEVSEIPGSISYNKVNGDIILNTAGRIINNTVRFSIWSNSISGSITNNTAHSIELND